MATALMVHTICVPSDMLSMHPARLINIAKQSTVLFADAANSRHGKIVASELKICIHYKNDR